MTDFTKLSDEELIQDGSEQAVNTLLKRYKNMVRAKAHLYSFVGADLEDVIQEGMIGLAKAIANYKKDGKASFATFAQVCVRNRIKDTMKSYFAQKNFYLNDAVPLDESAGDSDEHPTGMAAFYESPELTPEEKLIEIEDFEELKKRILEILTPLEKEVFEAFAEGYSYAEIAQKTGRSTKSVDNTIRRIKNKFIHK